MKKLRFLISLTNDDNDYQIEQAHATEEAARRLAAIAQIIYAGNDAITQSTQLLQAIQAPPQERPDAIVFEPVGSTALPQVARAAINAGIGWAVLNREATYVSELRLMKKAPIFTISADHVEIGRIQGRQFAALLPKGGAILYIQGPSENSAAKDRTVGMMETKPDNIQVTALKGQWTEESSQKAVRSWLKLTTSQKAVVDLIGAQDDSMAAGSSFLLRVATVCQKLVRPGFAADCLRPPSIRRRIRGLRLKCFCRIFSRARNFQSARSSRHLPFPH